MHYTETSDAGVNIEPFHFRTSATSELKENSYLKMMANPGGFPSRKKTSALSTEF